MLAGQPLAATIGFGTKAHIVTPFSMDLKGNGITDSYEVWELMKPHLETDNEVSIVPGITASLAVTGYNSLAFNGNELSQVTSMPKSSLRAVGQSAQHHVRTDQVFRIYCVPLKNLCAR